MISIRFLYYFYIFYTVLNIFVFFFFGIDLVWVPKLVWDFPRLFNKLTSVFYASVLLLIMNFVITLSK